jgi:hypothetical protein
MKTFTKIRFEHDYDTTPLDNAGHGPWRKTRGQKRPGERVMYRDHHNRGLAYAYLYDVQAAQQQALAEYWGIPAETLETLPPSPTSRQIAAKAVELDFEYLKGFLDGTWGYVGVIVELFDGETLVDQDGLWGVETLNDHHHQTAKEMADALTETHLEKRRKAEIAAQAEAAERAYWACRDVATEAG